MSFVQSRQNSRRQKQCGTYISYRKSHSHRRLIWLPGNTDGAGHPLDQHIESWFLSIGSSLTKAGAGCIDYRVISFSRLIVTNAQPGNRSGPEVFNHNVDFFNQI